MYTNYIYFSKPIISMVTLATSINFKRVSSNVFVLFCKYPPPSLGLKKKKKIMKCYEKLCVHRMQKYNIKQETTNI